MHMQHVVFVSRTWMAVAALFFLSISSGMYMYAGESVSSPRIHRLRSVARLRSSASAWSTCAEQHTCATQRRMKCHTKGSWLACAACSHNKLGGTVPCTA